MPIIARWASSDHRPAFSAVISLRDWFQRPSESIKTPSKSKMTAATVTMHTRIQDRLRSVPHGPAHRCYGRRGMTSPATVEREVKLGVWPGYALPDLSGVVDGIEVGESEEHRLDAVYYDTSDLRLLRRGVTLRFRRGEQPDGLWTAKLPTGTPAVGMARREASVSAQGNGIPESLLDLVRGWALGSRLSTVARLRTRRRRTTLIGGDGHSLARLDDDEVSILRGSRVAARFRELEVELTDDAPDALLQRLADRLLQGGAEPIDQVPKLMRALGPAAVAPWDLAEPELGAHPTAAEVIRAGLIAATGRFVDHLAAVALDEDPEGVHQARVGLRRLRSDMRTFGELLDGDQLEPLREELGRVSHELGAVRDLDVLLAQLRADRQRLDPRDRPGADELLAGLAGQRAEAYGGLRAEMRIPRYASLLQRVAEFATAPPFGSPDAERDATEVVPALVRRPLRRLRREVDQLRGAPDDAELHRVRILVKRLRYATDVAVPLAGKPARHAVRALRELQEVLGDHNDACVAVTRLKELSDGASPARVWSAGLLAGLQLARTADGRRRFKGVYKSALAKKNWAWAA
jgi:CHAD domain-containing protein